MTVIQIMAITMAVMMMMMMMMMLMMVMTMRVVALGIFYTTLLLYGFPDIQQCSRIPSLI